MSSHGVLAILMFAISANLYLIGYLAAPILHERGFTTAARYAFALFMISTATYLAWVGTLFAQDLLGGANYSASIIGLRLCVLGSAAVLLVQIVKVNR